MKKELSLILLIALFIGCSNSPVKTDKNILSSKIKDGLKTDREKFESGIGFTATGKSGEWNVDIDFDKYIKFTSPSFYPEVITPMVKETRFRDSNFVRYISSSDLTELFITITPLDSHIILEDQTYTTMVNISVRNIKENNYKEFKGYGKYLYDERLYDIWAMQEITGFNLKEEDLMKGTPVFEFNLKEMRFAGHAGCNNLMGIIDVFGQFIRFGAVAATMMYCPNMKIEKAVHSALSIKTCRYKIDGLKLMLESENGTKMVFRKID